TLCLGGLRGRALIVALIVAPKEEPMTTKEMETIFAEHIRREFVTKDVEATLATMVEVASHNHAPINSGGRGKVELRAFYRDVFIGSWPDDLEMTTKNRVF